MNAIYKQNCSWHSNLISWIVVTCYMANPIYVTIEKKIDFTIIYNDLTCTISDGWLSVYT